jgi:hypothetical protein
VNDPLASTGRAHVRDADALLAQGRRIEAVAALQTACRVRPEWGRERDLVRLRCAAFADLDRSLRPPWPPAVPDARAEASGPPVVTAAELTPALLQRGVLRHGSVWARGLVPPNRVDRLVEAIDRAFDAHDACARGGGHSPWFDPLEEIPEGEAMRGWIRDGGGVLAADSPRGLHAFLDAIEAVGIRALVAAYLGEPPALSAEKCTLRRIEPGPSRASWHQDGAFLGAGIRTLNAWIALSDCGRDAPGLDLIPLRLDHLLATGEEGAIFDWAVSPATIARELPGVPIWRPEFRAGDVLFFDHLCLHRTASDEGMSASRHAIESWFFAPSVYPIGSQTPILV